MFYTSISKLGLGALPCTVHSFHVALALGQGCGNRLRSLGDCAFVFEHRWHLLNMGIGNIVQWRPSDAGCAMDVVGSQGLLFFSLHSGF